MKAVLNEQSVSHLLKLLNDQLELYRALRRLSDAQRASIAEDRSEELLTILRERQTLILSLARLNEELGVYRRNWEEVQSWLPPQQRADASRLLDEINEQLRSILYNDRQDSEMLSARKHAVAGELRTLSGNLRVHGAYAGATTADKPATSEFQG
jgi:hypothetical protein